MSGRRPRLVLAAIVAAVAAANVGTVSATAAKSSPKTVVRKAVPRRVPERPATTAAKRRPATAVSTTSPTATTTTPTTAPTTAPQTTSPITRRQRVVGYVPYYADFNRVASVPADRLTHLIYAFGWIDPATLRVGPRTDDPSFERNYATLVAIKARNPSLQLIFGIGGGGGAYSGYFASATATEDARGRVARSTAEFLAAHPAFSGLDIDWEFPSNPTERTQHAAFVRTLRSTLDRNLTLSAAVTSITDCTNNPSICFDGVVDVAGLASAIDMWNVMAYNLTGSWTDETQHHAPLVARPDVDPFARAQTDGLENSGEHAIAAYLARGVPADRINLGIPFYGVQFCGVDAGSSDGLFRPWTKGLSDPRGCGAESQIDYRVIASEFGSAQGWRDSYDPVAKASWRYHPASRKFLSYESAQSLAAKRDWARQQGIGLMFWDMNADTDNWALLTAASG